MTSICYGNPQYWYRGIIIRFDNFAKNAAHGHVFDWSWRFQSFWVIEYGTLWCERIWRVIYFLRGIIFKRKFLHQSSEGFKGKTYTSVPTRKSFLQWVDNFCAATAEATNKTLPGTYKKLFEHHKTSIIMCIQVADMRQASAVLPGKKTHLTRRPFELLRTNFL